MKNKNVEDYLLEVSYDQPGYVPTVEAINFVNFIKMVNGANGEENKTPVVHMQMLDNVFSKKTRLAILCHRGFAKSTILSEYLPLYCAVYGRLDGFGDITYMMFIGDTMENGCRNMRKNMENRYNNSEFLQEYLPKVRFTDAIIEFTNKDGHQMAIRLAGAQQSIRGTRFLNVRPQLCVMDDVLSDQDARSPTCISNVNNTIHRGVGKAMHPTKNKIIYVGTVFNATDPLYQVIESGRWSPSVYPVCEKFPCTKEEFRGSWEDRFPYEAVKEMYDDAIALGRPADFFVEMMNQVTSAEGRLVDEHEIGWFKRSSLMQNRNRFNFYITTDFATSEKESADYSIIMVWAVNNKGMWFLVDGVCKRQLMDKNLDDLFRLAQEYSPQSVGVEVTGQQGGFIPWIQQEMLTRNIWFTLASENNNKSPGIRPNRNKLERFQVVIPWFKQNKMHFPSEWKGEHPLMIEVYDELIKATIDGFKSKHDDAIDGISMLSVMNVWRPSGESTPKKHPGDIDIWDWEDEDDTPSGLSSYIV